MTFDSSDSNMSRPTFDIIEHTIKSDIPPDTQVQAIVDQHLEKLEAGMQEEIGVIDCDLDGRFSAIRTQETNLGNLITDIMKKATRADIALLNSGTMRSDSVHEAGVFRMKVSIKGRIVLADATATHTHTHTHIHTGSIKYPTNGRPTSCIRNHRRAAY